MLMLTPCGETTASISICVDVSPPPICVCDSCVPHVSCVRLLTLAECVCVCVRLWGVGGQKGGDTMKWVAERAPPTIKALNGQPEVPAWV